MATIQASVTGLAKKWDDIIKKMPEFKDVADAAGIDELKKIIVDSEGNIYSVEKEMEANMKLAGYKDAVKEESLPYKEARKCQQAKIQYALFCLRARE